MVETAVATDPTLDDHLAASLPPVTHEESERTGEGASVVDRGAGRGGDIGGSPSDESAVRTVLHGEDDDDAVASEAGKTLAGRKKTARQRIEELTWEREQHRLRAERAETELGAIKQPKADATPVEEGKPKARDFVARVGTDYENYEDAIDAHADALTDWKLAKVQQASTATEAQRAYQSALDRTRTQGVARHANFDAAIEAFTQSGSRFTPFMTDAILTDPDLGHEIAYALATEPDVYQALASAPSYMAATKLLGKLLTRLEAAPPGAPASEVVRTKAQPPITPTRSSPVTTADSSAGADDLDAHIARENAREFRQQRR